MGDIFEVDMSEVIGFQKELIELTGSLDAFYTLAAKELAARLLALVIPRTPVGIYPKASGKKGGTLRRGWTADSEADAMAGNFERNAQAYANNLPVKKKGSVFEITIENPVFYAPFVEYGHRTVGGKSWVEGQFMLTLSEDELRSMQPLILERILKGMIREVGAVGK